MTMTLGSIVMALLLALGSVTVDGQSYEINRRPTTATNRNESGNNRYPASGAKREMVTVTREGERIWQFVCIEDCQKWSDVQLVRRALTLREQDGRRRVTK